MNVTKEDIEKKYNACVDSIDRNKTCQTCKHQEDSTEDSPCDECYNVLLGFPVDPMKWEEKKP